MKKILLILFLGLYFNSYAQQKKDSTVLIWTFKGKIVSKKEWSDSLLVFTRNYIDSIYLNKRLKNKK
jgi:hypothetical protein